VSDVALSPAPAVAGDRRILGVAIAIAAIAVAFGLARAVPWGVSYPDQAIVPFSVL
jgi:hypothetical protein